MRLPPSVASDTSQALYATAVYRHTKEAQAKDTVLFCGRLLHCAQHQGQTQWIFEAKDTSHILTIEDLVTSFNRTQQLYRPQWEGDVQDILSTNPVGLYWDRCHGKASLSHWIRGTKTWAISSQLDPEHTTTVSSTPVTLVTVTVSFQWTQHLLTFRDMAPDIIKHWDDQPLGPANTIGTLTHQSLENGWPETGKIIGPGCFVAHSRLTPHRATPYPKWIHMPWVQQGKVMAAQCVFYDVALVVGLMHRCRRTEHVRYAVTSSVHPQGQEEQINVGLPDHWSRHESIPLWHPLEIYEEGDKVQHEGKVYRFASSPELTDQEDDLSQRLQRFDQDAPVATQGQWMLDEEDTARVLPMFCDSLVDQEMGQWVLHHSLQKAKVVLFKGSRCQHIQVRGTINDWHAITVDDEVEWRRTANDPPVTAKVTSYELWFDATLGMGHVNLKAAYAPLPPDGDTASTQYLGWSSHWNDYQFKATEPESKPEPLPEWPSANVHVTNTLMHQIQSMADTASTPEKFQKAVSAKETTIRIKMRSPQSTSATERRLNLQTTAVFHPSA